MGTSRKTLAPCLAVVLLVSSMVFFSEAKDLVVGGRNSSWELPSSPDFYHKWAESHRFHIGDSIVWKYDGKTDSVLQVTKENYRSCNLSNPVQSFNDGDTRITLDKSGPFYFISGAEGHCEKGEKVEIRVLSARHGHSPAPSPAEDLSQLQAPAPSPNKNGGDGLKAGVMGGMAVVAVGVLALV